MNVTEHRWILIEGSIFTEDKFVVKSSITNRNMVEPQRLSIAFNVGREAGEQIVALHNEWYETKGPGWVRKHNAWAESVGSASWVR